MPYRQIFAQHYPASEPLPSLAECFTLLTDGRLSVQITEPAEIVATGWNAAEPTSILVMNGAVGYRTVTTPDGRFQLELDFFTRNGRIEFWLIHTDSATGRVHRVKLNTEAERMPQNPPRLTVSPRGDFFLVDDSGTVRLYSAAHLSEIGVFQIAHTNTGNAIIALTVTPDERFVAGLSLWKDIVVYDVVARKVTFVRQIRDALGWYEREPAYLMLAYDSALIVSAGMSNATLGVNAFQFVLLT
jgi:hypothetical protein